MKLFFMCLVSSLIGCSLATSCTTPLGVQSQCLSLYDCPSLFAAFKKTPIPNDVVLFLRNSQCGSDGNIPRVCCGSLPSRNNKNPTPNNNNSYNNNANNGNGSNVKVNNLSPDQIEPSTEEDIRLPSRDKCGVETNGDRIYGGTATELDEFPWMALLGYRTSAGGLTYQCGGVLINKRYVLTAAHCITGSIETKVGKLETIRLGEYDKRTEVDCLFGTCADRPQDIPVQVAVAHPGYSDSDKSRKDDIGIARLARRAQYNYFVQPICLVSNDVRLEEGIQVFVAGWGKTLSGQNSNVKEKLGVPIFRKDECISKYSRAGAVINDKQICAGGTFRADTCQGDSGGPLMRKLPAGIWESVAVVSFGNGCGMDGWPGVYTSVAHYLDWIAQTMRSTNV